MGEICFFFLELRPVLRSLLYLNCIFQQAKYFVLYYQYMFIMIFLKKLYFMNIIDLGTIEILVCVSPQILQKYATYTKSYCLANLRCWKCNISIISEKLWNFINNIPFVSFIDLFNLL